MSKTNENETTETAAPEPQNSSGAPEQTPKGVARYKVTLTGKTPVKFDHMPEWLIIQALIRGERPPVDKGRPLIDIAREKLYTDMDGFVGVTSEMLMACLREGGRKVPYDSKAKITGGNGSLLFGFFSIEEFFVRFKEGYTKNDVNDIEKKETNKPIFVNIARGQMDNGTTVGIVRPMINKWTLEFHVQVDYEGQPINPASIRSLFNKAGSVFGLGSHRPQKNGPYGQFKLAEMKFLGMIEDDVAKAA